MFIYAHNAASGGAKALAVALNVKRIKHTGSTFKPSPRKTVINWGSSTIPNEYRVCRILNLPGQITLASNKLQFFRHVEDSEVRIPDFTTDIDVARQWQADGFEVCERHSLTGHSAAGLRFVPQGVDITRAPLYTKYVPKKEEYRVHFMNGEILFTQQKKRRLDVADEDVNWKVRNHDNGFIYARENVEVPADVHTQARATIERLGLDFGAIDIIYVKKSALAYVLEVNTAPGLEGQSVQDYAEGFKRFYGNG